MAANGPFGFDPEDLERVMREAGDGVRELMEGIGKFAESGPGAGGWSSMFADLAGTQQSRKPRPAPEPETTGEKGDGVWAIFTVDAAGIARAEQVYATELDALRAHRDNTDARRQVRFLPYGVTISVFDELPTSSDD